MVLSAFYRPNGLALDAAGNLYIADTWNNKIRKLSPKLDLITFAGSGVAGATDGTGTAAQFNQPDGLAIDTAGNLYVTDFLNHKIRKITPAGVVSTLAGSGVAGYVDGTGVAAQFNRPNGITIDPTGILYVGDYGNNRIRKITTAGVVTTVAGSGARSSIDGTGLLAAFQSIEGLDLDALGNLWLIDYASIRRITPAGVVSTIAGSTSLGMVNGTGNAARFNEAKELVVSLDFVWGTSGRIYITDWDNQLIRQMDFTGIVSTLAGTGAVGYVDGANAVAQFNYPNGITLDNLGNLYVSDTYNGTVRKIAPLGGVSTLL